MPSLVEQGVANLWTGPVRLLDPHPLIRWQAVPGVSRYTVRVHGSGLDWGTTVDSAAQLACPRTHRRWFPASRTW